VVSLGAFSISLMSCALALCYFALLALFLDITFKINSPEARFQNEDKDENH